jgi:Hemerythrin HHE cation binding domain
MNAFELLKKDHENVSALFKQIEAGSETNKTGLFAQLKNELDVHAHIEETIFYPVLKATSETREITLEAYEEHDVVKDLLAELDSYGTPDDEWDAKLTVLKENVEHHVEEEEGEMFDKATDVLSQDQIEQLGGQMAAEKQQLMGETSRAGGAAKSRRAVGQSRVTSAGSKRETGNLRTGIVDKLANLVGLGSSSAKGRKKRSRKTSSRKSATKSTGSRKRQATKSTTSKRTRTSKGAAKRSTKTTAKRATKKSASRGSKRALVSSRTSALKTSRSASTKKRTSTKKSSTQKKSRKK